jgi:hypothetical protein
VSGLSTSERKAILIVELHQRQHGQGPSWSVLGRTLAVDRAKLFRLIDGLASKGAVTFTEAPGSLAVTAEGLQAAVGRKAA